MRSARALACPASLKGVLTARDAAAALAEGLRSWAEVDELPLADGGEGTLDVLHSALGGEWRVAEVAEAIPLDEERLDPFAASSRGLAEVIRAVGRPRELLVCLGGTANVDGGAGLLQVLDGLPAPTRVACDVDVPLVDAARLFSAQKGASPAEAVELEARLIAMPEFVPYAEL